MNLFLSVNPNSNDVPNDSRRDLVNLVSYLNRAEEIATSGPPGGNNGFHNGDPSSSLEPTPIRPDHEMFIRKQYEQHMSRSKPKKTEQFCVSVGSSFSDVSTSMLDDPLDFHTAVSDHMDIENFTTDHSSCSPSDDPFYIGIGSPSRNTSDESSASVRLRKYHTSQWDDRFQELMAFRQEHGHLLVPHSYSSNQKLAQWVKRQRHQYKRKHTGHHSTLTDEREEKLRAVGFIFDSHRAVWYARYETLKSYYLANGHCGIPSKFEDGSLNVWIKHQRRQYLLFMNGEKSTMTEQRIAALNSIGFNWNPRNFVRPEKEIVSFVVH
ncbi:helicase domain protein [Nitzschia inconspicua]|uniref:Helicase domain protein n=1 Tax=Nitzschia inconspicua TaxID=303405 RepID=A0A9K3PA90_9STRA|nr:helicase domain protein [Nitzschia inconspicua]